MKLSLSTYTPFAATRQIGPMIQDLVQSRQTCENVAMIALLAIGALAIFLVEMVIALPVMAFRVCFPAAAEPAPRSSALGHRVSRTSASTHSSSRSTASVPSQDVVASSPNQSDRLVEGEEMIALSEEEEKIIKRSFLGIANEMLGKPEYDIIIDARKSGPQTYYPLAARCLLLQHFSDDSELQLHRRLPLLFKQFLGRIAGRGFPGLFMDLYNLEYGERSGVREKLINPLKRGLTPRAESVLERLSETANVLGEILLERAAVAKEVVA